MTDEGSARLDLTGIGAQGLSTQDPRRIGAFPILAVLGSGGMGRVYLGLAPTRYAAVKQVLPTLARDAVFLRHFGQELDNQARLPAGVSARLLAADRTARPPWFATEYVPGVTLHAAVHLNGGALPTAAVWVLLRELAQRLARVAGLEMVHRDLKPSNVMLTEAGITLIDFGVARAADQSSVTATGLAVGTPAYMAPEQARARKDLTPAVDVFSLGGLLAFAATGEAPFGEGSGADLLYRVVHDEPDLNTLKERDRELADLVASCLVKDPAGRPTAAEVAEFAQRHAQPGPPSWPTVVTELIAVRRAFALSAPEVPPAPASVEQPDETGLEEVAPEAPAPMPVPSAGSAISTVSKKPEKRRGRRVTALVLPIVLVVGTAGAVIALHEAPFTTSDSPGSSANQLAEGAGKTGSASAAGSGSAGQTATASPPRAGSTPTASGSTAASLPGSGTTAAGAPVSRTTGAAAGSGSGGNSGSGSGGGSSKPSVVAKSYSAIENAAQHLCVGSQYGGSYAIASPLACDGDSGEGWQITEESGAAFKLVEKSTGACLYDTTSINGSVSIMPCSTSEATGLWHVGATTSKGGELVDNGSGHCPSYTTTNGTKALTSAGCDSADADQLWYDAGAI